MTETKNLFQKLLAITEEVGKIEKTGKNTQQGYAFIEQAQIVAELRPQLAKHGVMIIPETLSRTMEQVTNKNGTVFTQANVVSRYTLVNADDPKEVMICEWDGGEALDTSDKATNKAVTASHKSFLMKLFNISDKDDPDAESPQGGVTKVVAATIDHETGEIKDSITEAQLKLAKQLLKDKAGVKTAGDAKRVLNLLDLPDKVEVLSKDQAKGLLDYLIKRSPSDVEHDVEGD